uniref:Uncharacterized protein n=1 Tax=Zooxanthella nutricula TaxID=1333877 RepID=A0A7S2JG81_9DINO
MFVSIVGSLWLLLVSRCFAPCCCAEDMRDVPVPCACRNCSDVNAKRQLLDIPMVVFFVTVVVCFISGLLLGESGANPKALRLLRITRKAFLVFSSVACVTGAWKFFLMGHPGARRVDVVGAPVVTVTGVPVVVSPPATEKPQASE